MRPVPRPSPWLAALAPLLLAGCGEMRTELVVRPDGSATLKISELVTDLPNLAKRHDPGNRYDMATNHKRLVARHCAVRREDVERAVRAMGPGAHLNAYNCSFHRQIAIMESADVAVRDVNRTDFSPFFFLGLPLPPAPAPEPAAEAGTGTAAAPEAGAEAAEANPVAAAPAMPPPRVRLDGLTLRIGNYWRGDFARALADGWFTGERRARAAASLPYLKNRMMDVTVRMEGKTLAETNARHILADRSGVVLARVSMEALVNALLDDGKRAALERLRDLEDEDERLKAAEKIIPTLQIDGAKELFLRFE